MKIVVRRANSKTNGNLPPSEQQWYYREIADNGEVIGVSEMYVSKQNAVRAAHYKQGLLIGDVPVEIEEDGDDD